MWVIEQKDPDEPEVIWCCAVCEQPFGEPHKDDCKCTLYEGVPVEDVYGNT